MTVPVPVRLNAPLWAVLREGPPSPFARWFDVDWGATRFTSPAVDPGDEGVRSILMPVLGSRIGQALAAGEPGRPLRRRAGAALLRARVPRPSRHRAPAAARPRRPAVVPARALEGRRQRAELPALLRRRHAGGRPGRGPRGVRGHPPAAARPRRGRVARRPADRPPGRPRRPPRLPAPAADASGGSWVVVEKILEGEETLPEDWPCAGTTGYDALPGSAACSSSRPQPVRCRPPGPTSPTAPPTAPDMHHVITRAKHEVVAGSLYAEVHRLVELLAQVTAADIRLRDHTRRGLEASLVELLVAFDRYRAYVVPGETAPPAEVAVVERAAEVARAHLPEDVHETLDLVRDLVLGREAGSAGRSGDADRAELVVRFQQTCGPVMAKGDRGHRLLPLVPAGRAERGRRRPGPVRRLARASCTPVASGCSALAHGDDDAVDARHQAGRGRPGPPRRARPRCRRVGRRGRGWHAASAPLCGRRCSTRPPSTCSGRPWSPPGTRGRPPDRRGAAAAVPRPRRCARPSCTPPGPRPTSRTRRRSPPSPTGVLAWTSSSTASRAFVGSTADLAQGRRLLGQKLVAADDAGRS